MWYLQSFRFELHMSLNNDPIVICTIRILSKWYRYSQLPKSSRLDKSDSEFKSGEIFIFFGESVEKYLHCNMKFSVQTFSICVSSELWAGPEPWSLESRRDLRAQFGGRVGVSLHWSQTSSESPAQPRTQLITAVITTPHRAALTRSGSQTAYGGREA